MSEIPQINVSLPSQGGDPQQFQQYMELIAMANLNNPDFNTSLWIALMKANVANYNPKNQKQQEAPKTIEFAKVVATIGKPNG